MKERAIYYLSGFATGCLIFSVLCLFMGDVEPEYNNEFQYSEEIAEINQRISEPNEASYKAFFGWE